MKMKIIVFIMCVLFGTGNCEALNINVSDGSAHELIKYIAREGNINVLMASNCDAKISINLQDVTPLEAIKRISLISGMEVTEAEGALFIGPREKVNAQFGDVHIIPVQYADLDELKNEVEMFLGNKDSISERVTVQKRKNKEGKRKSDNNTGESTEVIQNRGRIGTNTIKLGVDINTRSLLIYGTQEDAAAVKRLVECLDVPAAQVSLEAKVVAVKRDDAENLGVTWNWTSLPHNFSYEALVNLLISQGRARVLSRPNILTLQGREAVINIGGDVPVPAVSVTSTTTTTSIDYRPAGIILRCRPFVNKSGDIESILHIEVSAPSYVKEMKAYSFQKRSVDTRVRMKDGETLVIGGLISREEAEQFSKIPWLNKIPILGSLFQYRSTKVLNEEIMVFIKAQILQ